MIVDIKCLPFDEKAYQDLPVVHEDDRRIITEEVTDGRCLTCILVKPGALPLGHHYHIMDEPFRGRGSGKLYLVRPGGDLSNPEVYDLPADDWEVTVPKGWTHTLVFDGESDENGFIAILVSDKTWRFNEDPTKGEVNTYRQTIAIPAA